MFSEIAGESTLQLISYYLFNKHGLLNKFHIDKKVFLKFFHKIEIGYLTYNNLYHNNIHAAEVLQTCHYIFGQMGIVNYFSDIDVFATMLNCAIHDFQHDGFSQKYHETARTDLAILYNDKSVHCNNSVSQAYSIALRSPGCNIFSGMTLKRYRQLRDRITELCYSFDLALYHERIITVKKLLTKTEIALKPLPILQHICHCCDLGQCGKSWSIHSRNAGKGLEEFFLEGDTAKAEGFSVALMTSRRINEVINQHIFFFEVIIQETFSILNNCIIQIQQEKVEYSVETPPEEDEDSHLECEADTDLSSKRVRPFSLNRDRFTIADVPSKKASVDHFPWTVHIAENIARWTQGGIFGSRWAQV